MVGFRNIAVHEYQALQLPITVAIITQHLDEFLVFSSTILRRDTGGLAIERCGTHFGRSRMNSPM